MLIEKKNKKGMMGLVLVVVIIFTILVIGFFAVIGLGVFSYASDKIVPELQSVGMIDNTTNFTAAVNTAVTPITTILDNLPWLLVFGYGATLIFSLVAVVFVRYNPHPLFIGIYFMLMIMLIFMAILMSNAYEDLYNGNDDLALELQANAGMSYLLLYSPAILTVIAIFTGIFMFAGNKDEGGFSI